MKNLVKINRQRRRASRCFWALLALPLLHPVAAPQVRADAIADTIAKEAKAKADADAKVKAAQTPLDKINALYNRAHLPQTMILAGTEDWPQAEAAINEAVRIVGEVEADGKATVKGKENIYFWQGFIEALLHKYPEAITAYDRAEKAGYAKSHEADPHKGSDLWHNRGAAKTALYDVDGAIADYQASIALDPRGSGHKYLAQALYDKGDMRLAVAAWQRAFEVDATIGDAPFDVAQVPLNKAIYDHPRSAAPLIERARYNFKKMREAKVEGDDLVAAFGGNEDSKRADLLEPALDDLDRAVQVEPQSVTPLIERGRMRLAYIALKPDLFGHYFKYEDTQQDFEQAIALDPKNAEAWFESGVTRLKLWQQATNTVLGIIKPEEKAAKREAAWRGAIRDFSRAIYLKPDASGEAHFQRANVERQLPHPDVNALLVDCSAAIAQNLAPLDAAWHQVLHPLYAADPGPLGDARCVRGKIFLSRGQFAAALADFDGAIALWEGNREARFERGKLRVQRGDYDGALEDLSRVLKDNPKVGDVWMWRGVAHDGKGETAAALADLKEAIARDAKIAARLRGSRYDAQNPDANRGLAPKPVTTDINRVPPGTALDHKNAGNALRGKNDADGALQEYNLALLIDPNFADALNNRAALYQSRGEVDLAMADYNRAIASDPKHRVAYFNRAGLWKTLGETEKQMADLDRAIEFAVADEPRATAYGERALARQAANLGAEALADAKKATELAPKSTDAWEALGELQLNGGDHAVSIASFRRAIAEDAEHLAAHFNLSLALGIANDAEAATEFEQALHLAKPEQLPAIRNGVARALRKYPESAALKAMQERAAKAGVK